MSNDIENYTWSEIITAFVETYWWIWALLALFAMFGCLVLTSPQ